MGGAIWKPALIGAAYGAAECAVLFLASDRYTLANDWFLAVMVVVANATGFGVAARYGVSLIGVALAGLAGMMVGGWVGVNTIGSYEYTVPTPREEREMRIITPGRERVIEMKGVPEEKVKRIPVGGGLGVLVGFAVGALLYARLARPADAGPAEGEVPDAKPSQVVNLTRDNICHWPAFQELLDAGKVVFDAKGRLRYNHGAPVGRMILVRIRKDGTPVYKESAEEWFDPESPVGRDFVWPK